MKKLSKLCPVGLDCLIKERHNPSTALPDGGYCSNSSYCFSIAAAWPLPYQIWEIDDWYDKGALIVSIPNPSNWNEVPNNEWDILAAESYDAWVDYITQELRSIGWANPIDLPYVYDDIEKRLMVTEALILKQGSFPGEGFAPPVFVDNWRSNWIEQRSGLGQNLPIPETDKWGFYLANGLPGLAWAWQE